MRIAYSRKGQALVLVTLALFAMVGLMGLAVDMGWSFYIEKTSQAAADAAATAAVIEVHKIGSGFISSPDPYAPGNSRTNSVGGTVTIFPNATSPYVCPSTLPAPTDNFFNRDLACMYALRNGFGAAANSQTNVMVYWGNQNVAPEVPDVTPVHYWTTVYVAQRVPQLFSAILGNTEGLVASKATAAIVDSESTASLWLLNRINDCVPMRSNSDCGINLMIQANPNNDPPLSLNAQGGVLAASEANGTSGQWSSDPAAMMLLGGSLAEAPFFAIHGEGGYYEDNNAEFLPDKPTNGFPSSAFDDPTEGLPNPPLPNPSGIQVYDDANMDGVIPGGASEDSPTFLYPRIYAATATNGSQRTLTGSPIRLSGGYYKFLNDDNTQSSFGTYTFIGGLEVATGAVVSMAPGQYVMMGAKPLSDGTPGEVLAVTDNAVLTDGKAFDQPPDPGYAGQLFVLAGPNYTSNNGITVDQYIGRAAGQLGTSNASTAAQLGIKQGKTRIHFGNNSTALFNARGLNADKSTPLDQADTLDPYRRFLIWQDRDNSVIEYDNTGHIVLATCQDNPCTDPLAWPEPNADLYHAGATELLMQASPKSRLYGVVYQPRGSYTHMQGGGGYSGPLQLITGAFRLQGGTNLNMQQLEQPLVSRVVALIQ